MGLVCVRMGWRQTNKGSLSRLCPAAGQLGSWSFLLKHVPIRAKCAYWPYHGLAWVMGSLVSSPELFNFDIQCTSILEIRQGKNRRSQNRMSTCRNYLFIVKLENSATKIWMGRLPFSHVRMNYFWWAKTERIVVYSAVNLLFRNNKIQLSKCHHITIFMNCKISLTYISETHWKQSIK